ncbi:MAG: hypothetical protein H6562_07860 [Lewinellaceae bacterium]|nr:hypothetical protein [Lewinella sp.]MCB9278812.1 hypothetical protein [Lewinellaceae bacterium]
MKSLFIFLVAGLLVACGKTEAPPERAQTADGEYTLEDVPGTTIKLALKKDGQGKILEEGYVDNGVKTGVWMTFDKSEEFPKTLISYVNGIAEGPYFEFNDRGQIELKANYKNNKLDGPWGRYSFGRPLSTAGYKNGELDGIYREFDMREGKIQKEIYYKDGKEDGPYRYFNDQGEVTVEYNFKNGEKVGGGMVEH